MKKPSISFSLTHRMAGQVCEIAELVGSLQLQTAGRQIVSPDSDDHIHGIQSLLALEHTSLESEQIRSMCQGGLLPELERVSLLVRNLKTLLEQPQSPATTAGPVPISYLPRLPRTAPMMTIQITLLAHPSRHPWQQ